MGPFQLEPCRQKPATLFSPFLAYLRELCVDVATNIRNADAKARLKQLPTH
jgi:hypothetical protein